MQNQMDPNLKAKQNLLLQKRENLLSFECEYWKQKGKTLFLSKGDANTSCFHAHATIRRNHNQIKEFLTKANVLISSPSAISQAITKSSKRALCLTLIVILIA